MRSLQSKIITDWDDTYICEADIWTAENIDSWKIIKIDNDGSAFYPIDPLLWKPTDYFRFKAEEALNYDYGYSIT